MKKIILLLPVYNDWKSCNHLLKKLNDKIYNSNYSIDLFILNDASTYSSSIVKNLNKIKTIKIINFKKNIGSQKVIYFGLKNLKNTKNKIIAIMDSDGEDDVGKFVSLIKNAEKYPNKVIVACRTKRKEIFIFKLLYKLHLILTFILTLNWINYGNYSAFNALNLKKILKNKNGLLAHSSTLIKNCKIKKIYAERKRRYFGNSKVSFPNLFLHSLRVIANFQARVLVISVFYVTVLTFFLYEKNSNLILINFTLIIFLFNILLIFTNIKLTSNIYNQKKFFIKKIK